MSRLTLSFSSADPLSHLKDLQDRIRKEPQRADLRIFLFQLYCLLGEWVKAANQLVALEELDPEALPLVQTYREAVRCEVLRRDVFAGERTPLILGDPADWIAWMLEAIKLNVGGRPDEAAGLRQRALDLAPASAGQLDEKPFVWLADGDSRLGPILEAIVAGKYYWVPFQRLSRIEIDPPADSARSRLGAGDPPLRQRRQQRRADSDPLSRIRNVRRRPPSTRPGNGVARTRS